MQLKALNIFQSLINQQPEKDFEQEADAMAEQEQQVRCSSSESENFEKIDSEDIVVSNGKNPNFIVGDESPEDVEDDGPSHEGRDSFPNAPPTNIRRMMTPAQQLALAEKRSTLRPSMSQGTVVHSHRFQEKDFTVATPEEFVRRFQGTKPINKVLIANNGIGAVKCMRSIRRWSYEMFKNERAVRFVVMVTPEDLKANAEYIKMADHYVPVPGGSNNNNYANVELIVDIAVRTQVQAVWAGWGHASENPKLPELLHRAGVVFIGPPEKAMWALGDKIASSIVAQTADIPTLPWSGSNLKAEYNSKKIKISSELFGKGCVSTVEQGLQAAHKIGFPVMIKASEGGGGKGIRKVENPDDFANMFRQVQAEVPGSPIFVMKLAKSARHLEVQLLADQYGNAISLFGRDCSIQRRHQKIIEEAPAAVARPEVFIEMEKAAVRLAKMVGYVSAGTVEYLYEQATGAYFFLELNPRLQVEHPCTEMVADVNLPAAQLQIAMGLPLYQIKDIRLLYGESPWGMTPIEFDEPKQRPSPWGHVIAARITSENPDEGFKPSSGTVQELNFRSSKNVWGYFSVAASGGLHEFADSQFGHCFSWGETREQARENLVIALKELSIRGDFRTTVEYLITLLETAAFQDNNIDTSWLDALIAERVQSEKPDIMLGVICGSILIADSIITTHFQEFKSALEKGQIQPSGQLSNCVEVELIHSGHKYKVQATKSGPTSYFLAMNGSFKELEVHKLTDGGTLLSVDGASYTTYLKDEVDKYRIVIGNQTVVFEKEKDPSKLRAPSAGKLINTLVEDGGHVDKGQPYAEIEVMKMVMTLLAPEAGKVTWNLRPGAVLDMGALIGTLELDDPSLVTTAQLYKGQFPLEDNPQLSEKLNHAHNKYRAILENTLSGYCLPEPYNTPRLREVVEKFMQSLRDPSLPLLELQEVLSSTSGRIPVGVEKKVRKLMALYERNITSVLAQFPSQQIASVIDHHAGSLAKRADRDVFFMSTQALVVLVQRYRNGIRGRMKAAVHDLLKQYYQVESHFQLGAYDKCVMALRERYKDDMQAVANILFSHNQVAKKNLLVTLLIDHLWSNEPGLTDELAATLNELTSLHRAEHSRVALRARQVLIAAHQPAYELRHNQMESIFLSAVDMYGHDFHPENLQKLILSETSIFDILHDFFYHTNAAVCNAALEVYVRRAYMSYDITCLQHLVLSGELGVVHFQFILPTGHPNRIPISQSEIELSAEQDQEGIPAELCAAAMQKCHHRTGALAAFQSFDQFVQYADELLDLVHDFASSATVRREDLQALQDGSESRESTSINVGHDYKPIVDAEDVPLEPIHILMIGVRDSGDSDDSAVSRRFGSFCRAHRHELHAKRIRRITFMLLIKCVPLYFISCSFCRAHRHELHAKRVRRITFMLLIKCVPLYFISCSFCRAHRHELHAKRIRRITFMLLIKCVPLYFISCSFCRAHRHELHAKRIRRITFMLLIKCVPLYFISFSFCRAHRHELHAKRIRRITFMLLIKCVPLYFISCSFCRAHRHDFHAKRIRRITFMLLINFCRAHRHELHAKRIRRITFMLLIKCVPLYFISCSFCRAHRHELHAKRIRRITFMLLIKCVPLYFISCSFCRAHHDELHAKRIRRITFMLLIKCVPLYFISCSLCRAHRHELHAKRIRRITFMLLIKCVPLYFISFSFYRAHCHELHAKRIRRITFMLLIKCVHLYFISCSFCRAHCHELHAKRIRRITFMLLIKRQFPKFFTYRARNDFTEDTIYRHLEPASAFQLELYRMRSYDLEALPTSNQKMHLYLGKAKVKKGQEVTDYRFFIRSIIRHQDLITKEASFEYLQNEGERVLLEAMDELEVAFSHQLAKRTDCNHIFLNFGPTVIMDAAKIEESVLGMVMRYGPRLWKLRVLQAEIRFTLRMGPGAPTKNVRLCLSNGSGYSLDVYTYEEVSDPRTGVIMFQSYGPRQGPMHGLPISTPYVTKDYLQQKRFLATSQGTTYVYDIPDMFRQCVERRWRECIEEGSVDGPPPDNVMTCVELVVEPDGERRVVEVTRLPGQNTVGMVAWRLSLYTPECPRGRDVVLLANDLTHYMGSFGPHEDWLFYRASQYARDRSIPRVSTACAAANDLTHYMGSFGPHEDWLFYRASQYARDRSIPRVSTACAAANDLTHYMGSFGPHEDWLFYRASQYARDRSILRVSTACAAANDLTHYMGSFGPHEDWLFYRASQYVRATAPYPE
ncbi:unnamed protein product [Parnassius apollo]|uniref:(apollo) hypothetical protein n=1 Tax=Parnassius apollo TaxID=110799 RepID=A0A8S3W9L9_PARAO|nr:unnamed protein product [Parnassius apollo]